MALKLNWTLQARQDLIAIAEYIAQDSKKYARLHIQRIRARTKQLVHFPDSGRMVPEYEDSSIRELVMGNYRIIYRKVTSERIDIITVHHSARQLKLH